MSEKREVKLEEVVAAVGELANVVKNLSKRVEQLEKSLANPKPKKKVEMKEIPQDLDVSQLDGQSLLAFLLLRYLENEEASKTYHEAYKHFREVYMQGVTHGIKIIGTMARLITKSKKIQEVSPEELEKVSLEAFEEIERSMTK